MKISGCLIVRNEEKNISECLGSFGKTVDEIIVVDTGSEDNTVDIALESGARVFHFKWNNDFSAAKNFALDHAAGDWIIFLDADEYFDDVSLTKIRSCIAKADEIRSTESILCKIVNIDIDTNNIISNNQTLRIFRNERKCRFINKIHEEIRYNGRPLRYIDASDEITLYHTGYSSSLQKAKAERNLELLLENSEDEKTPYYLSTTYYILKDYENALKYADIALSRRVIVDDGAMGYKMYTIKAAISLMDKNIDPVKIESLFDEARIKCGNHPEITKSEAAYYLSRKHYNKALEKFRESIKLNTEYGSTFRQNDFPGMIDGVYFYMGRILDLMNSEEDALSNYVEALKFNKYNTEAFDQLMALLIPVKDEEVIYFLNSLYQVKSENDVKFLVSRINRTGRSGIILYYVNIWNKVFEKEDDILIFAYLALKEYDKALEIALLYLRDDKNDYSFAVLVAAIVILGELYDDIENDKGILPVEILKLIYHNAGVALSDSSLISTNSFIAVFSELVNNADRPAIEEYLKLSSTLDNYTQFRIADVFLINCKYEKAIQYYSKYFNLVNSQKSKADAAFKAGYCYYKQRKFAESLEWFEKAIRKGHHKEEIHEYLIWINEQCHDGNIKDRVGLLMSMRQEEVVNEAVQQNTCGDRGNIVSYMFEGAPLVSVIVLAYNKVEFTRLCVESIYQYSEGIEYELILVNNGSTDGTQEYFESLPKKRIVYIEKNHGACNGFNEGIKAAKGRYIACVCNDFIFTKNWLSNLITCIQSDERIGFVSPGASYMSNLQQIDGSYNSIEEMQKFAETYNISNPKKWEERIRLLPNVLFVKREIFDIVGYYDPIFIYGEFADDDLAFRIRRAGYKLIYAGDTFTYHFGSVTGGKAQRENKSLEASREIFKNKHDLDAWSDVVYDMNLIHSIDYEERCDNRRINILGVNPLCGATILQIKNMFRNKGQNKVGLFALTQDPKYYTDLMTICDEVVCGTADILSGSFVNTGFDYIVLNSPINNYRDYCAILGVLKCKLKEDGHIILPLKNNINFFNFNNSLSETNLNGHEMSITENMDNFNTELMKMNLSVNKCIKENFDLSAEQNEELNKLCNAQSGLSSDSIKMALRIDRYIVDIIKS